MGRSQDLVHLSTPFPTRVCLLALLPVHVAAPPLPYFAPGTQRVSRTPLYRAPHHVCSAPRSVVCQLHQKATWRRRR
eukprot:scaffold47_cov334-Pavlova_lutheri.AAC.46